MKECKEARASIINDRVFCSARADTPCEDLNYTLYNYSNCPLLEGSAHDNSLSRIGFRMKIKLIEFTIRVFKNFLRG